MPENYKLATIHGVQLTEIIAILVFAHSAW